MNTKDHLVHEFTKMIAEEYEKTKDNLATGSAQNFEQYLRQVGKVQGLSQALEFLQEADDIVMGQAARGN